jgi:methionyl-tRNA synthetase
MDRITFDDFAKVNIRIGKILSVEEVPETDKLLKLMVDFGEEAPRQIISGIKDKVADPQVLVGLKTTFVVNLEPRTIRGLESNGMLFAVGEGETFSFLAPLNDVPPGTGTK